MFEFLFDIKPDAGNVCPTTRLAYLISERGNKVYYTDTSDSVFTTGLLRKGIGRIIYPHDFRWFTPHLALLDYQLQDKQQVYNKLSVYSHKQNRQKDRPNAGNARRHPAAYSL